MLKGWLRGTYGGHPIFGIEMATPQAIFQDPFVAQACRSNPDSRQAPFV